MKLDRSKFLLLASSIASGCIITTTSDGTTNASADDGAETSGSGRDTSATSGSEASTGDEDSGTSLEGDGTGLDDESGGDDTGEVCDDELGSPDCTELPEPCETWEYNVCNDHLINFKPAVAEAAIACMHEEQCDDVSTYLCAEKAVLAACPDDSVAADCETILENCEHATLDACEQYLAGLTETGRAAMVDCMSGVFCSFGFYTCLEGL